MYELKASAQLRHKSNGHSESQAAQQVHPQGAETVIYRLFRTGISNHKEGNHTGNLPEEINPDQILGQNQTEHSRQEQKQHGEEKRLSVLHLRVVFMISFHVSHCINTDKSSDKCNDNAHQNRQPVHHHMRGFRYFCRKFCVQYNSGLNNRKNNRQYFPIFYTQPDDQTHQKNIPRRHQMVDQLCLRIKHLFLRSRSNPLNYKHYCCKHNNTGTCIDDVTSCLFVPHELEQHRQHCRYSDQ